MSTIWKGVHIQQLLCRLNHFAIFLQVHVVILALKDHMYKCLVLVKYKFSSTLQSRKDYAGPKGHSSPYGPPGIVIKVIQVKQQILAYLASLESQALLVILVDTFLVILEHMEELVNQVMMEQMADLVDQVSLETQEMLLALKRVATHANFVISLIVKANKLLIRWCYRHGGYHKRDTEEVEGEPERIEREERNAKCVYYVQYDGGKQCNQYYKYVLDNTLA